MNNTTNNSPHVIEWLGPSKMSDNGLQVRGVVAKFPDGLFHAGTLYGPKGVVMPMSHLEDSLFVTTPFKEKEAAIEAAKIDAANTLKGCNEHAKTEKLLEQATTPRWTVKREKSPARGRGIER